MMFSKVFHIRKQITSVNILIGLFWISVFSLGIISELNIYPPPPLNGNLEVISSPNIPKLMSDTPISHNKSLTNPIISTGKKLMISSDQKSNMTVTSQNLSPVTHPLFQITGSYDVSIDNVSPEAMEINATNMVFELNFTIQNGQGQDKTAFRNITISNSSFSLPPITTWEAWTPVVGTDEFSLTFILNETVLSQFSLGMYNLTFTTEVLGHTSSDRIEFPMKDLKVSDVQISPSEFNNKDEETQFFNITIQVTEDLQPVEFLAEDQDPKITLHSSLQVGIYGELNFIEFYKNGSTYPYGEFIFEVSLSESVARDPAFDDAVHTLVVSVISATGISDNGTADFEARGIVLLTKITEVTVGSNPPFDYGELTTNGSKHVEFRVNVNDSINVKLYIWDNSSQDYLEERRTIYYQDPNDPDDPTAVKVEDTYDNGTASIFLTANSYTPISEGYTVQFYVRGHKSSQEEDPSNITIFWDLLEFDFIYYDKQSQLSLYPEDYYGSYEDQKLITRGVDIGDWWVLNLSIQHKSDQSPAYGAQIRYRFASDPWEYETDGTDIDNKLNGMFTINHTSHISTSLLFECQIDNGSIIDPQGTYFVDKTYGPNTFNLTIIWTYLIIEMVPGEADQWLGTGQETNISLFTTWAHDNSAFSGTLNVFDDEKGTTRNIVMDNGIGFWPSLLKTKVGKYNFSVNTVNDPQFAITKFTNPQDLLPDQRNVKIVIIWDEVYFVFSERLDQSRIITIGDSLESCSFFTNYGDIRALYCYGRHYYNNEPFVGNASLVDRDTGDLHYTIFNAYGIGNYSLDRTDARRWVEFRILQIISEPNYDVKQVRRSMSNNATILWEKVRITLSANKVYSHGAQSDIIVSFQYEVSTQLDINPEDIEYTLKCSNGTVHENISWTYFSDYSFGLEIHWYNITEIFDYKTGLTGFEIYFDWLDDITEPEIGNLTIYWVDDKAPVILEFQSYDLGNGTILIIVDATDDAEEYQGSGVADVSLFDRENIKIPLDFISYLLSEEYGIYRYIFKYSYNQTDLDPYFKFEFGDTLSFFAKVTDHGTPNLPDDFDLPEQYSVESELMIIEADYDPYSPQFISQNGTFLIISYQTIEDSYNVRDGDVFITTRVQDHTWSGLSSNSVQLNITNIATQQSSSYQMKVDGEVDVRSELSFRWDGNLPVGETYRFTVTITDNAGNNKTLSSEMPIEDRIPPRIYDIDLNGSETDRTIKIEVKLIETGLGIDFVTVGLIKRNSIQWVNLTRQGGMGSQQPSEPGIEVYSALVTLDFDLMDVIIPPTYSIQVIVSDLTGNEKIYSLVDLQSIQGIQITVQMNPIIFHPVVLILGGLLLVTGIVIGIRITSKTVGYDIQKIISESERISREEMLIQMDEYALGVTINFFDQVQGPVPVIWEPPLLEDQQQVMLDLSDKSFSTLEFVTEETERSGIFDFSTGSYECTALGYSFAVVNPEARGGKENLTVVLLLRKEWGDNLLTFQDELLEKLREIREMVEKQQPSSQIELKARNLREFVSRLMLTFNKMYRKDQKLEYQEE
ncbi:MAG: hypothetical protein ACFFC6_01910 [Promethearchaeota archaeon]